MHRVYATQAQYEAYTGQAAPADIVARLGRASRFLESEVFRLGWYDADGDGYPTHTRVREAFADAVCAQVQWWAETNDELGTAGRWQSVKIGTVALSGPGSSASARQGREVADAAPEALRSPDMTTEIFRLGEVVQC
ncbi:hypothetical protein [Streptomyces flavofungini]|uniref:hypothetical protein n=1 Tax=Streptomyces flavofungini TaxID=68200 RepID=UPI0025AF3C8A|nr:hypothetical protein [Streptomyces flavofungini]WJV47519.1 hypothetical protein QUY26_19495 [Streptomyces flavofungini]